MAQHPTHAIHRPPTLAYTPLVAAFCVALAGMLLGACSTTEGFGKDVKNLGGDIEDSAAKNK